MTPALPNDLLEEIFLRLPPDEPEWLFCASLSSKLWLHTLSSHSFRRRCRELHGAPPTLGYLYHFYFATDHAKEDCAPNFLPVTKFRPHVPDGGWRDSHYEALDCRHGRALFVTADEVLPGALIVWDPMTGCQREMYKPDKYMLYRNLGAAVLCAAHGHGCDRRTCHGGPFLVAFLGLVKSHGTCSAHAWMFSSETGEWSKPHSRLHLGAQAYVEPLQPVLIKDALYFMVALTGAKGSGIVKYDMGSNSLSLIDVPAAAGCVLVGDAILMGMEDGSLGLALKWAGLTINMWSMQIRSDKVVSWTRHRIDLKKLFPIQNLTGTLILNGSMEGRDIIFVTVDLGVYEVDLRSPRWKKQCNRDEYSIYHINGKSLPLKKHLKGETYLLCLIPYTSFYDPQERVKLCNAAN